MKYIGILAWFYKFFGAVGIFFAAIMAAIMLLQGFSTLSLFSALQGLSAGIASLILAHELLKREKWAWYVALLSIFTGLVAVPFSGYTSFGLFLAVALDAVLLILLFKGRYVFTEQPKERLSYWLSKKYFILVVIGIVITASIFWLNKLGVFN